MKIIPRLLLALSLSATAVLTAQTTTTPTDDTSGSRRGGHGGPGRGGPGRGGHPIIRALDADKDREVSATELAGAPAAIRALDANNDGVVSKDEFHPARPAGAVERPAQAAEGTADATGRKGGHRHRGGRMVHARAADPVMLALDANSDGALAESEIVNATTSLSALDLNKDGKLTVDELRPLPPAN